MCLIHFCPFVYIFHTFSYFGFRCVSQLATCFYWDFCLPFFLLMLASKIQDSFFIFKESELVAFFMSKILQITNLIIQTWVFGTYFLENEVSLSVQGKQLIVFIASGKIQALKENSNFGTFCCLELDSFPILRLY